ncbi:GNAT family N-acetyltransferase [Caldovatus sp. SYSU G05006]|uniref:GNAT family N-acetyltransferase n=1 Tax=Caldovatus aquaticus TaxID=2865671 RepID=A0ABS7F5L8_9PROT|nr:GNAT family N-acetyltransferase [Caldovatus aquaticus]
MVEEPRRGRGIGRALLARPARRLRAAGAQVLHGRVRRRDAPAIAFYRCLGAGDDAGEWQEMSLSGDALVRLAGGTGTTER